MTTWIGTVQAAGFVFDESLIARADLLTRLLSLWSDGARLGKQGTRWYLVGLAPRRVDAKSAPGTPLAWVEGRWLSAPHTEAEIRAAPLDAILDLHAGTTRVHRFASLEAVHPVDLLELEQPRVLPVTLLEPPPKPVAPPRVAPTTLDQVFKSMLQSLDEAPRNELVAVPPAEPPRLSPMVRLRAWLAGAAARRAERAQQAAREREQRNVARAERERAERAARLERAARAREEEEARQRAAGPSLWSRALSFFAGAASNQPTTPARPDAPREDARREDVAPADAPDANAPSLWSRVRSWFGGNTDEDTRPARPGDARLGTAGTGDPSVWSRLRSWFGSGTPERTDAVENLRDELNRPPREPLDPSVWDRLARWLAPAAGTGDAPPPAARQPGLFTRLLASQGPEAQKNYLDDLRRRFLEGDLAEALRRALPLGSTGGINLPPTGLVPPRRSELSLLTPNATGAPSMVMPNSEYEQMRTLYREAADKLIAEGRIEEAAYLLARLLNDAQAGVALLEKHGKIELAAQLATVQHLPEMERIRLWLLAGRTEEAIRVVRGSRDFAALINALNGKAPDLARRLRGVWGEYLANHDRYTEAIVATAPLAEPPESFPTWVDRAYETGGANAATALAVDLGRYPEHAPAARQRLDELLATDQNSTLTATTAALLATHAPKAPPPLYRDLWRRLMHGASQQHAAVEKSVTDNVLRLSGDAALQADAVVPTAPAWRPDAPLREIPAPAVPGLPLFDVADLPKGRRALAEGAAGLRVISREGKTVRQHLVKADSFVVGPVGTHVLVISRDGHLTRVWKLHPRTLELTSWFQANLDCFAPRYDGLCWPVGMEHSLVLLDPATPAPMEWWRVPGTLCRELDLTGSQPHVIALAKDIGTNQTWRVLFDVGAQKLERRLGSEQFAFQSGTQLSSWEVRVAENAATVLHLIEPKVNIPLAVGPRTFLPTKAGLAMTWLTQEACTASLIDWRSGALRITLRLSRVRQPVLRELAEGVVVCDEFGRVTAL